MNYKALWCFGALVSLVGVGMFSSVGLWWGLGAGIIWIAVAGFTGYGVLMKKGKNE